MMGALYEPTGLVSQDDLAWQIDALCAETDPEIFFPEKGGSTKNAKSVCAGCEVAEECLAYAMRERIEEGIWGGLSDRQRRKIRSAEKLTRAQGADDEGAAA